MRRIKIRHTLLPWLLLWMLQAAPALSAEQDWCIVDQVIDGDTVRLADGRAVRYIGINAPEIDHSGSASDPLGVEAAKANQTWIGASGKIRLEMDNETRDRFGRLLAYVSTPDGRCLNLSLIEAGLAYVLYFPLNSERFDDFLRAQREAMRKKRGLWRDVPEAPGPLPANPGTKRFHTPQCPLIGREATHYMLFKSQWEAFWHGFAPCSRCLPSPVQQARRNSDVP